jgi:hypothetical protein
MPTGNKDNQNPDFDADYDFSKMDFGGSEETATGTSKAVAPAADDDDVFAGFGGGAAQGTDDFESEGEGFEFEDMPDPNRPMAVTGNVDDEFSDLTNDRPAARPVAAALNDQDDDPFADEGSEFEGADANEEDLEDADDADDPFGAADDEDEQADEEEEVARPARRGAGGSDQRSSIMKYALPLAAVLGVGFLGYSGYNYVLPMFSGAPAPQQQAQASLPPQSGNFPQKLPGQPAPVQATTPVAPAQPVAQLPAQPLPTMPNGPVMNQRPPQTPPPAAIAGMGQSGQMAQPMQLSLDALPGGIVLPDMQAQPNQQPLPPQQPVQAQQQPIRPPPGVTVEDDLVGGRGRSGIGVPKDLPAPAAASASFESRFTSLAGEIDGLKRQIASLSARLDGASRSGATPVVSIDDGLVSEPAKRIPDDVVPPLKPVVVEGVSLKGVSRDVAWVSTVSGVVEVKEGDNVPNAGDVVKIRPYGGEWIVVTTQGIVVR